MSEPITNREQAEQAAFETFADAYPHKAAEEDWPAFVCYTRQRVGWEMPEEVIRKCLKNSGGQP